MVVSQRLLQNREYPDAGQEAHQLTPLFERVDGSVLTIISEVFASSRDRRAIDGFRFLAHLLRLAQITRLSLFPTCEVAVIEVKSVWDLCRNPSYEWPYCYEATSKYLRILCALGLLIKPTRRKGELVLYYFPLCPTLSPPPATELSRLSLAKNKKIGQSRALRSAIEKTYRRTPPITLQGRERSVGQEDRRLQEAVMAVCGVLEQVGFVIPAALQPQIKRAIVRALDSKTHEPGIEAPIRSSPSASPLADSEGVQESALAPTNLLSPLPRADSGKHESALAPTNLLSSLPRADSCTQHISESVRVISESLTLFTQHISESVHELLTTLAHHNTDEVSEYHTGDGETGRESARSEENSRFEIADSCSLESALCPNLPSSQPRADSVPGHRPVYLADSLSLPQEHQADFFLEPDGSHPLLEVANELSRLFEQNQSRVGHYLKLLSQDQEAVRLAVIDAWMRSAWPDPDRQQKKSVELGGGWVTRRYQTYLAGERPPDEFQAWANTTYSYTLIKRMFEAIASYQWSSGGPLQRPLPAQSGEATPQAQTAGASFQFDASGKLLAAWTQGPDEPAGEERGSGGALDPATTLPLIGKHAEREEPPQGDVLKKVRSGKPLPARLVKDIARLQAALGPAFAVQAMVFSQSRKVVIGLQGATQIWYVSTPGDGEALLSAWAQQEGRAEEVVKGT